MKSKVAQKVTRRINHTEVDKTPIDTILMNKLIKHGVIQSYPAQLILQQQSYRHNLNKSICDLLLFDLKAVQLTS